MKEDQKKQKQQFFIGTPVQQQFTTPFILQHIEVWFQRFSQKYLNFMFQTSRMKILQITDFVDFLRNPNNGVLSQNQFKRFRRQLLQKLDQVISTIQLRGQQNSFFSNCIDTGYQCHDDDYVFLKSIQYSPFKRRIFWGFVRTYISDMARGLYSARHDGPSIVSAYHRAQRYHNTRVLNFNTLYTNSYWFSFQQQQQKMMQIANKKVAKQWGQLMGAFRVLRQKQITKQSFKTMQKHFDNQFKRMQNKHDFNQSQQKKPQQQQQDTNQQQLMMQFYAQAAAQAAQLQKTIQFRLQKTVQKQKKQKQRNALVTQQQKKLRLQGQALIQGMDQINISQQQYQRRQQQFFYTHPRFNSLYNTDVRYRTLSILWFQFIKQTNYRTIGILNLKPHQKQQLKKLFKQWYFNKNTGKIPYFKNKQFMVSLYKQKYSVQPSQQQLQKFKDQSVQQYFGNIWDLVQKYYTFWNKRQSYIFNVKTYKSDSKKNKVKLQKIVQQRKKRQKPRMKRYAQLKQKNQLQKARLVVQQYNIQKGVQKLKQSLPYILLQGAQLQRLYNIAQVPQSNIQPISIQQLKKQISQQVKKSVLYRQSKNKIIQIQQQINKNLQRQQQLPPSGTIQPAQKRKLIKKKGLRGQKISLKKVNKKAMAMIQKALSKTQGPYSINVVLKVQSIFKRKNLNFKLHNIMMQKSQAYKQNVQNLTSYVNFVQSQSLNIQQRQIINNQIQATVQNIFSALRQSLLIQQRNLYQQVMQRQQYQNNLKAHKQWQLRGALQIQQYQRKMRQRQDMLYPPQEQLQQPPPPLPLQQPVVRYQQLPLINQGFPYIQQLVRQTVQQYIDKPQQAPNHQLLVSQAMSFHQVQNISEQQKQIKQQLQKQYYQANLPLRIQQLMTKGQKKTLKQIIKSYKKQKQLQNTYQNKLMQNIQRKSLQPDSFNPPLILDQPDQYQIQLQHILDQIVTIKKQVPIQQTKQYVAQIIKQTLIPIQSYQQALQQSFYSIQSLNPQQRQQYFSLAQQKQQRNDFQVQFNLVPPQLLQMADKLQKQPLNQKQKLQIMILLKQSQIPKFIDLRVQQQLAGIVNYQYYIHNQKVKRIIQAQLRQVNVRRFPNNLTNQSFPIFLSRMVQYVDMNMVKHFNQVVDVPDISVQADNYTLFGNAMFVVKQFNKNKQITKLNISNQIVQIITVGVKKPANQMVAQQINIQSIQDPSLNSITVTFLDLKKDLRSKVLRVVYRLFQIIRLQYSVQQYFKYAFPTLIRRLSQYKQQYWITYSVYTTPQQRDQKQFNLYATVIYNIQNLNPIITPNCYSQLQSIADKLCQMLFKQMTNNFVKFYQKYQPQINNDIVNVTKSTLSLRGLILPFTQDQQNKIQQFRQNIYVKYLSSIYQIYKIPVDSLTKIPWKVMGKQLTIFQKYKRDQMNNQLKFNIKQPSDALTQYKYYNPKRNILQFLRNNKHRKVRQIFNTCLGKIICFMLQKQFFTFQFFQQKLQQHVIKQQTLGICVKLRQQLDISYVFSPFIQISSFSQQTQYCVCVTVNHIYMMSRKQAHKQYFKQKQSQNHKIKYNYVKQDLKIYTQNQVQIINMQRKINKKPKIFQVNYSQKFKNIQYSFRNRTLFVDIQCVANQNGPQDPYMLCFIGYPQLLQSQIQKCYTGYKCIQQFFIVLVQFLMKYNYTRQQPLTIWTFNGNKYQMSYFKPKILQYFGMYRSFGGFNDAKFHSALNGAIIFKDARTLLTTGSLKKLCIQFDTAYKKQQLDIKLYKNIVQIQHQMHKIAKYCKADCLALMSVLFKFWVSTMQVYQQLQQKVVSQNNQVRRLLASKICKIPTAASLALQIFKTGYLKNNIQNNQPQQLNYIQHKYYFGGVTQVINHTSFQQTYPVDINSSYPKSMTKQLPWFYLGQSTQYQVQEVNINQRLIVDCYFYQINQFKFKQNQMPICPIINNQKLFYPIYWKQQYQTIHVWGHTLQLFQKYNVVKFYKYNNIRPKTMQKIDYIKKYTQSLYKFKAIQKKQNKKKCIKLLLNSLYGKFGQKQFGQITIYDKQTFNEILKYYMGLPTFRAQSQLKMGQTYWQYQRQSKAKSHIGQFVRISSFISSSSRALLGQASKISNIQNIFYCDTDSLYLNKKGYQKLVQNNMVHDKQLGKWKLQQKLRWAIFISPKTAFGMYLQQQKFMIKWKGCPLQYIQKLIKEKYKQIGQQFMNICKQYPRLNIVYQLQSASLISSRCQAKQGCVWFIKYRRRTNVNFKRYALPQGNTLPCMISNKSVYPYLKQQVIVKQQQQ